MPYLNMKLLREKKEGLQKLRCGMTFLRGDQDEALPNRPCPDLYPHQRFCLP